MIDVTTTCHGCGTITIQRMQTMCDNCKINNAQENPHHRCNAIEQCDCLECWPIDEEHDRYYEDRDVLNRIAED